MASGGKTPDSRERGIGHPRGVGVVQVGMGSERRKGAPSPSGDERLRETDSSEVRRRGPRDPCTRGRPSRRPLHLAASGARRPGAAASSRRSPTPRGPAGLRVTCALPPVSGDHGLAGDGVQPGGALRLLAAGGEKGQRPSVSGGAGGAEGLKRHRPGSRSPLASPPRPPGPRAVPGSLLDEEDSAAPGDPVRPGPGQGADPLQVQIRRHV